MKVNAIHQKHEWNLLEASPPNNEIYGTVAYKNAACALASLWATEDV